MLSNRVAPPARSITRFSIEQRLELRRARILDARTVSYGDRMAECRRLVPNVDYISLFVPAAPPIRVLQTVQRASNANA